MRCAAWGLLCLSLACRRADRSVPMENRLSEFLDNDLARPLLLADHQELRAYLEGFPREEYDLRPTANGFSFFIERTPRLDGIKLIISKGGVWEDYFLDLMARYIKPGTGVVDAGAYIGTHSLAMARLAGPAGRVYAFEPQKKAFRELAYNLIENRVQNVIPLRFALGEANRIIEMDRPMDGLEAIVKVGRGGDRVELRTLDSFGLADISFMKIDVEGYEDPLLEGARRTIADNHNPPILIEHVGERNLLEDYGYTVTPLEYRDYLALPAPAYALGTVISFADRGNAGPFKSGSWSYAEPWGTWTASGAADLVLPLVQVPRQDLVLTAMVKGYVNDRYRRQEVWVQVNGRAVDRWIFRDGNPRHVEVRIPASLLQDFTVKPLLRLTFQIKKPAAPAELGLSGDRRLLGLGVQELTVKPIAAGAPPR